MKRTEQPNTNYLEEIANGDKAFRQQLIGIIKKEFPGEKKEFLENFNNKKYVKAAENVHKLKHKINIFGLEQGYNTAMHFEEELKQNTFAKYSDFIKVLDSIENYLKTL